MAHLSVSDGPAQNEISDIAPKMFTFSSDENFYESMIENGVPKDFFDHFFDQEEQNSRYLHQRYDDEGDDEQDSEGEYDEEDGSSISDIVLDRFNSDVSITDEFVDDQRLRLYEQLDQVAPSPRANSSMSYPIMEYSRYVNNERQMVEEGCERGSRLMAQHEYKAATSVFAEVLKLDPKCCEAYMQRAVCYISLKQEDKAIQDLEAILRHNPHFNRNVYIMTALCFKRKGDLVSAVRQLLRATQRHPNFLEAYIARGELYLKQNHLDKALQDFRTVIQLNPRNATGYRGLGDVFRGFGSTTDALKLYSQAILIDNTAIDAYVRRAVIRLDQEEYHLAHADLSETLRLAPNHGPALFHMGMLALKEQRYVEAVEYLSESVEMNPSTSGLASFELGRIRMERMQEYDQSFNDFKRASLLMPKDKRARHYKMLAMGICLLARGEFEKALKCFQGLTVAPAYQYRGYTHTILGNLQDAVKDITKALSKSPKNKKLLYNQHMNKGIIALNSADFENAIIHFTKAVDLQLDHPYPFIFRATALVGLLDGRRGQSKPKLLDDAMEDLNIASIILQEEYDQPDMSIHTSVPHMKSIVCYVAKNFGTALTAVDQLLSRDARNARLLLFRGKIQCSLQRYEEAIHDISEALKIMPELKDAYLYRGRCEFLLGRLDNAFLDHQKSVMLAPDAPAIHSQVGDLLLASGNLPEAVESYGNAIRLSANKHHHALYQRAKCLIRQNQIEKAMVDFNRILEIKPADRSCLFDRGVLSCLQLIQKSDFYRALVQLNKWLAFLFEHGFRGGTVTSPTHKEHTTTATTTTTTTATTTTTTTTTATADEREREKVGGSRTSRGSTRVAIPAVKSTRPKSADPTARKRSTGKNTASTSRIERPKTPRLISTAKSQFSQAAGSGQQTDTAAASSDSIGDDIIRLGDETFFRLHHIYLYRGICEWYLGNLDRAMQDYKLSAENKPRPKSDEQLADETPAQERERKSIENFETAEFFFNVMLISLKANHGSECLDLCRQLVLLLPQSYHGYIDFIRGLLLASEQKTEESKKAFMRAYQRMPDLVNGYLNNKDISIAMFPTANRLCSFFPLVKIRVGEAYLEVRPTCGCPLLVPPSLAFQVDESVLSLINHREVVYVPEPPWDPLEANEDLAIRRVNRRFSMTSTLTKPEDKLVSNVEVKTQAGGSHTSDSQTSQVPKQEGELSSMYAIQESIVDAGGSSVCGSSGSGAMPNMASRSTMVLDSSPY